MSKYERFEVFSEKAIKDNEQLPQLLDTYQGSVRLNEFDKQVSELKAKLRESNRINEKNRLELEKLKQNDKLFEEKMADNSRLVFENEQIKAKNEMLNEDNYRLQCRVDNFIGAKLNEIIDNYERQFKEKYEEIEKLKEELEQTKVGYDFIYKQSGHTIKELSEELKFNTHQVCKKIREYAKLHSYPNEVYTALDYDDLIDFLNQMEKGED